MLQVHSLANPQLPTGRDRAASGPGLVALLWSEVLCRQ